MVNGFLRNKKQEIKLKTKIIVKIVKIAKIVKTYKNWILYFYLKILSVPYTHARFTKPALLVYSNHLSTVLLIKQQGKN